MSHKIYNIGNKIYDIGNKIFLVCGFIMFVATLAIIAFHLFISQTLAILFYNMPLFISLGFLLLHIWWFLGIVSYCIKRKRIRN